MNALCNRGNRSLLCMYVYAILIHMKTTLNIDDALLAEAGRLTRITEKTALVRAGLKALIAIESGRRLAQLGGTERDLRAIPRRRSTRRTSS
jgi:Arc/MetJ family transcription regulator